MFKYKLIHKWFLLRAFIYSIFGLKISDTLYSNPLMKWPRNKLCFCGSMTKFKSCCNLDMSKKVNFRDLVFIKKRLTSKGIRL